MELQAMASTSESCSPSTNPFIKVLAYALLGARNGTFPDLKISISRSEHLVKVT